MKIFVKAKPGAKTDRVQAMPGELFAKKSGIPTFMVAVKERAADGRANRAIEKALADHFSVPVARVRIVSGHTSREKIIEIIEIAE